MRRRNLIFLIVVIFALFIGGYFVIKIHFCNDPSCSDNPLIGGCAGVHPDHVEECCERWAQDNDIPVIQCVGTWIIEDGFCSLKCDES